MHISDTDINPAEDKDNKKESITKEEKQAENEQVSEKKINDVNEMIIKLDKEIKELKEAKKLQEEIKRLDKLIQEIIRSHMLSNRDAILMLCCVYVFQNKQALV
ncbi:hypothetical protein F8M41_007011 [Gigaspora margarita]|uniref:Uncharacterized protein n=1 Tax=Gigaspora margarita TaxID=4874 RepID=A0A8H4A3M4_GIGMA|nr:hypothetical protein F8M41_007011 [Gigaspora margarita]